MANEKRLIDVNKLSEHKFQLAPTRYRMGWNDAIDAVIENTPTIDAVEVVRCKDCRYRQFSIVHNEHWCDRDGGMIGAVNDDDFCSYGERRTDP